MFPFQIRSSVTSSLPLEGYSHKNNPLLVVKNSTRVEMTFHSSVCHRCPEVALEGGGLERAREGEPGRWAGRTPVLTGDGSLVVPICSPALVRFRGLYLPVLG